MGFVMLCLVMVCSASAQEYDPLHLESRPKIKPIDLTVKDEKRKREIPVRVFLPEQTKNRSPVILFSHGLGGSRRACGYAGRHWSSRGYAVVVMQHAGSDESVWKDLPVRERLDALKGSTSFQTTVARFRDVVSVIDQLENWNNSRQHQFYDRMDLKHIGMSGHSYGAATTQGVSGQSSPRIGQRFTDKRIDAAIMFSPNRPRRIKPEDAFGKVSIPWMLMTGTKDTSPINNTTVADRRMVYPALPSSIDKFELVLHGGEHHAFNDGAGQKRKRDPNHHRVILALSTAFWDAYLKHEKSAMDWLTSNAPKQIMTAKDEWQFSMKGKQKNPDN